MKKHNGSVQGIPARYPDILPKDTLPKDIFPNGHFADGHFVERTFCRMDRMMNGLFAEHTIESYVEKGYLRKVGNDEAIPLEIWHLPHLLLHGFMDTVGTSDRLWPTVSARYKCIVIQPSGNTSEQTRTRQTCVRKVQRLQNYPNRHFGETVHHGWN